MALTPTKIFEDRVGDEPRWVGSSIPTYRRGFIPELDSKQSRLAGVLIEYNPHSLQDCATLLRLESWLNGYKPFLYGKVNIEDGDPYVVRFERVADAEAFWHHCIRNPFTYSAIKDVYAHD